jgi:hypothetical protein
LARRPLGRCRKRCTSRKDHMIRKGRTIRNHRHSRPSPVRHSRSRRRHNRVRRSKHQPASVPSGLGSTSAALGTSRARSGRSHIAARTAGPLLACTERRSLPAHKANRVHRAAHKSRPAGRRMSVGKPVGKLERRPSPVAQTNCMGSTGTAVHKRNPKRAAMPLRPARSVTSS